MKEADKTLTYLAGTATIITFLGLAITYSDNSITGMAYRSLNYSTSSSFILSVVIACSFLLVILAFLFGKKK